MKKKILNVKLVLLCLFTILVSFQSIAGNYDSLILSHNPIGYWLLIKGYQSDASGHGMTGSYKGSGRGDASLPNGETASVFNGIDNYFEIPDNNYLEVTRTGILTIEAWMRPDVEDFPHTEGDGYVHWMGKGTTNNQLWVARMYNKSNASRPQRISGYCFNLSGGLGTGSYFQDIIPTGTWIHYVLVINTVNTSTGYPTGYTKIYRDGVQRDMDRLDDYNIVPGNGTAPMRIATRDLASFFKGAIGKVAIYDYELTSSQISAHNSTMRNATALSIQFESVTAQYANEKLNVNWQTFNETNVDHFGVQVSNDGINFKTINVVESKSKKTNSSSVRLAYGTVLSLKTSAALLLMAPFWGFSRTKRSKKQYIMAGLFFLLYSFLACSKQSTDRTIKSDQEKFVRVVSVDKSGRETISKIVPVLYN